MSHTGPGVANCHQLTACHAMARPLEAASSGAWSCEDGGLFCPAVGPVPPYSPRRSVWSCDRGHAYGGRNLRVFPGTRCYTACPSFRGAAARAVASSCEWDRATNTSVWGGPSPASVVDSEGDLVQAADRTPSPACGCGDLVLAGEVEAEEGKSFLCLEEPRVEANTTTIAEENECSLLCGGQPVFRLYCEHGAWSVPNLTQAADISCREDGGDKEDGFSDVDGEGGGGAARAVVIAVAAVVSAVVVLVAVVLVMLWTGFWPKQWRFRRYNEPYNL